MTSFAKIAIGTMSLSMIGAGSAYAQAAPEEFTTAAGDTLILSPIAEMECDEMEVMLSRIDSTGYRENAPTPHDEADTPLFEYELTLAEENYHRCVISEKYSGGGFQLLRRFRQK